MPRIVKPLLIVNYLADSAIAINKVVTSGTADEDVAQVGTASATPVGIALEAAADNTTVDVCMFGPCIAIAGGTITRLDLVESDGNGDVIALTPGSTTSDTNVVGTALESAVDNDLVSVFVGFNTHIIE